MKNLQPNLDALTNAEIANAKDSNSVIGSVGVITTASGTDVVGDLVINPAASALGAPGDDADLTVDAGTMTGAENCLLNSSGANASITFQDFHHDGTTAENGWYLGNDNGGSTSSALITSATWDANLLGEGNNQLAWFGWGSTDNPGATLPDEIFNFVGNLVDGIVITNPTTTINNPVNILNNPVDITIRRDANNYITLRVSDLRIVHSSDVAGVLFGGSGATTGQNTNVSGNTFFYDIPAFTAADFVAGAGSYTNAAGWTICNDTRVQADPSITVTDPDQIDPGTGTTDTPDPGEGDGSTTTITPDMTTVQTDSLTCTGGTASGTTHHQGTTGEGGMNFYHTETSSLTNREPFAWSADDFNYLEFNESSGIYPTPATEQPGPNGETATVNTAIQTNIAAAAGLDITTNNSRTHFEVRNAPQDFEPFTFEWSQTTEDGAAGDAYFVVNVSSVYWLRGFGKLYVGGTGPVVGPGEGPGSRPGTFRTFQPSDYTILPRGTFSSAQYLTGPPWGVDPNQRPEADVAVEVVCSTAMSTTTTSGGVTTMDSDGNSSSLTPNSITTTGDVNVGGNLTVNGGGVGPFTVTTTNDTTFTAAQDETEITTDSVNGMIFPAFVDNTLFDGLTPGDSYSAITFTHSGTEYRFSGDWEVLASGSNRRLVERNINAGSLQNDALTTSWDVIANDGTPFVDNGTTITLHANACVGLETGKLQVGTGTINVYDTPSGSIIESSRNLIFSGDSNFRFEPANNINAQLNNGSFNVNTNFGVNLNGSTDGTGGNISTNSGGTSISAGTGSGNNNQLSLSAPGTSGHIQVSSSAITNPGAGTTTALGIDNLGRLTTTVSAGTTINPTDGQIPVRMNATTFIDSSIVVSAGENGNDITINSGNTEGSLTIEGNISQTSNDVTLANASGTGFSQARFMLHGVSFANVSRSTAINTWIPTLGVVPTRWAPIEGIVTTVTTANVPLTNLGTGASSILDAASDDSPVVITSNNSTAFNNLFSGVADGAQYRELGFTQGTQPYWTSDSYNTGLLWTLGTNGTNRTLTSNLNANVILFSNTFQSAGNSGFTIADEWGAFPGAQNLSRNYQLTGASSTVTSTTATGDVTVTGNVTTNGNKQIDGNLDVEGITTLSLETVDADNNPTATTDYKFVVVPSGVTITTRDANTIYLEL